MPRLFVYIRFHTHLYIFFPRRHGYSTPVGRAIHMPLTICGQPKNYGGQAFKPGGSPPPPLEGLKSLDSGSSDRLARTGLGQQHSTPDHPSPTFQAIGHTFKPSGLVGRVDSSTSRCCGLSGCLRTQSHSGKGTATTARTLLHPSHACIWCTLHA